jgi:hypothetical protein
MFSSSSEQWAVPQHYHRCERGRGIGGSINLDAWHCGIDQWLWGEKLVAASSA